MNNAQEGSDIDAVFTRLDEWRHLPCYQLERRADIFISLCLAEALGECEGLPKSFNPRLIPEFPVLRRDEFGKRKGDELLSFKVDYLALSQDRTVAALVELKTDHSAPRLEQLAYLIGASSSPLTTMIDEIIRMFKGTKDRAPRLKYFALILQLEELGLVTVNDKLRDLMGKSSHKGLGALFPKGGETIKVTEAIKVTAAAETVQHPLRIVYVTPSKVAKIIRKGAEEKNSWMKVATVITLCDLARLVEKKDDPLSRRFAKSLRDWDEKPAGYRLCRVT